jgi:hypothetical protein
MARKNKSLKENINGELTFEMNEDWNEKTPKRQEEKQCAKR